MKICVFCTPLRAFLAFKNIFEGRPNRHTPIINISAHTYITTSICFCARVRVCVSECRWCSGRMEVIAEAKSSPAASVISRRVCETKSTTQEKCRVRAERSLFGCHASRNLRTPRDVDVNSILPSCHPFRCVFFPRRTRTTLANQICYNFHNNKKINTLRM